MSTKDNPGKFNCYENAKADEHMFILLARDRHASALVRLWAELREKEGEDPDVVAEARQTADVMAKYAQDLGKPVLDLPALASFLVLNYKPKTEEPTKSRSLNVTLIEGDFVKTGRGNAVGVLEKIIKDEEGKPIGTANVRFGKQGAVTVPLESLRKPTEDELVAAGFA